MSYTNNKALNSSLFVTSSECNDAGGLRFMWCLHPLLWMRESLDLSAGSGDDVA